MGEESLVGQVLGRCRLVEEIGRGGFGCVYRAEHADLGLFRAVKVATDPEFIRQLRKEGRLLARLRHLRIVEVYDMDVEHDPPYIVMEYVGGGDLRKLLERGPLPVERAVQIMLDVLEALEHAHNQSVIHRDIKPSNILLDSNGRAKVSDFGLGRIIEEASMSAAVGRSMLSGSEAPSGLISGTLRYMSPEQLDPRLLEGDKLDHRSDLYSLGLVFYEMLTGVLPVGVRPALPSEKGEGIHAAFDEVFLRCTAADREERAGSAGEVAELVRGAWEEEAKRRERIHELTEEATRLQEEGDYRNAKARWQEVITAGGDGETARAGISRAEATLERLEAGERKWLVVRQSGLRHGDKHRRSTVREQLIPEAARFPDFDRYLTLILALILLPFAVAGGMDAWGGWSDVVPFVMCGVIAVYAAVEGVRLRQMWLSMVLAALMAALPSVSLFFYEGGPEEALVMLVVMPGAAAGIAGVSWVLSLGWARSPGLRTVAGCLFLVGVFLALGLGGALLGEYTGSHLVAVGVMVPFVLLLRWWFNR